MLLNIPDELIKYKEEDGCLCLNNHLCTLESPEECTRNFLKFKIDKVDCSVASKN